MTGIYYISDVFFTKHVRIMIKTCLLHVSYKMVLSQEKISPGVTVWQCLRQSSKWKDLFSAANVYSILQLTEFLVIKVSKYFKNDLPYFFLLPLFQEGQLSVTGESMCTKYWLTAEEV